ncbi:metalloregulator ArsR/SmtB family transcription factor [Frigidibacter sp. RF13]|uniref:ArsR/SmtB family transcription factor n=1 Tax=Frigidibacter sp. RF13 TaxID=2997340 RepID=UPI002270F9AE|nr:metalloregulator ArsR/SmtB family transcription factor [Frigidibacter sp. RF13]MCY1127593.1 metalloregulator ArsR/SmtB family transcription factor [Frigidibacter sp. RF13]
MTTEAATLDRIFTALANPTRRAILDRLSLGAATVNELVAPFALSQPTISSHLRILEQAGLVERGRQANFRPVRLAPHALADAHRWIGRYEAFWAEGLERLEAYAKSLQEKEKTDGSDPGT